MSSAPTQVYYESNDKGGMGRVALQQKVCYKRQMSQDAESGEHKAQILESTAVQWQSG